MTNELTHASFFSGVGGTDLGLERAGWRTVSFSEIDPYASAVLAERWPGVPNLGDIVALAGRVESEGNGRPFDAARDSSTTRNGWSGAVLWTGGFPCQDLSVAGKRRGMVEGTRSNLVYAFLALVERHRPPAILLENVPGLLSSHGGRDMAALCGRMAELGYGVAYRILDAQHFGVPQRRRRVFIVGLRSDPDDVDGRVAALRAAAVLSVGSRCPRHPATGHQKGERAAEGVAPSVEIAGNLTRRYHKGTNGTAEGALITSHGVAADGASATRTLGANMGHHGYTYGAQDVDGGWLQVATTLTDPERYRWDMPPTASEPSRPERGSNDNAATIDGDQLVSFGTPPDADGVRAPDGLAGRLDDRGDVGPVVFDWQQGHSEYAVNDALTMPVSTTKTMATLSDTATNDDALLPLGLDSHRYRCCGNGVVAPVAEWLGHQLMATLRP